MHTLYVKLRLRKSPYSNKFVALRITCNYFEDFTHKDALFLTEVNPACGLANLQAVVKRIAERAGCCNVKYNTNAEVVKLFGQL